MANRAKRVIFILLTGLMVIALVALIVIKFHERPTNARIIATNFIGYDLARAVTGDASEVAMLLSPGADAHDYDPTPADIINIEQCELFIYVGGESDAWVTDLLQNNEISPNKTLRLMDYVDLKLEDDAHSVEVASNEHVDEYDEHIWTSPTNVLRLIAAVEAKLAELDPARSATYEANAAAYATKFAAFDHELKEISSSTRYELIFADRFPFRYLVDEYGLDYLAAFPGCSEQTEASSATIARLIDEVQRTGTTTVLKLELTSDSLARAIAEATGATILELHSGHNISQSDFTAGITYADIMANNLNVLRKALGHD